MAIIFTCIDITSIILPFQNGNKQEFTQTVLFYPDTEGIENEVVNLYPEMKLHGYEDIEAFIWDHNKERIYERVRDTVDDSTESLVAGAAFHWYSKFDADHIDESIGRLTHEIMGDLNAGMCAFYDWNLLLDEQGGPNHVGNFCHAPFLYDTKEPLA